MTYKETIQYLYSQLPVFHRIGPAAYKADMGNIETLCDLLGQPQKKFRSVHIAGTNGKGSVSHMLASVLQCAGYKTGLHTSPHLKDYRERFRINGKMIPHKEVVDFVARHKKAFEEIKPSFFEMSVALAFDFFAKQHVDIAIIETGMGGRLDSTNILLPELSVITNIGFDHMMFLGDTLEKIASEKAGIIKHRTPVVIGESLPETRNVFIAKANEMQAPIYFASEELNIYKQRTKDTYGAYYHVFRGHKSRLNGLYCQTGGDYQQHNILTVLKAIEVLTEQGFVISDKHIRQGLSQVITRTGLRGRWQVIGRQPLRIVDVGHNQDGIRNIVSQMRKVRFEHLHFVIGMVNDKDVESILSLFPPMCSFYFCKPDIPRGLDAHQLAALAKKFCMQGDAYESVQAAYQDALRQSAKTDLIIVCGSTFVVAEVI
jgi:dihydrofolate synthase / folylpolyglutamate synthase